MPLIALWLWLAFGAGEVGEARRDALTVMTFNIRYGTADDGVNAWANRRDLLLDVLRETAADLVGLQEALAFQIDAIEAALPQYAHAGVGRDDGKRGGEYACILYRKARFTVVEDGTFWFSDTPQVPGSKSFGNQITRICTWARLRDERAAHALQVFNLHLDHQSQPSRERSTEMLGSRLASLPKDSWDHVLVLGDFNAGEQNAAITRLVAAPRSDGTVDAESRPALVDTFRVLHPDDTDVGTFHAFLGTQTGDKIDYVLAPRSASVLEACIIRTSREGRFPSDHFPVMTRLRLASHEGK